MLRNPIEFRVWDNSITVTVTTPLFKSTYEKLKGVNINQFVRYILETHRHILGEDYVSVNGRLIDKVIGIEEVTHEVVIAIIRTGQIETHSVTLSQDDEDSLRGPAYQGYGGPLRDTTHNGYGCGLSPQPSGYGDPPSTGRWKG